MPQPGSAGEVEHQSFNFRADQCYTGLHGSARGLGSALQPHSAGSTEQRDLKT